MGCLYELSKKLQVGSKFSFLLRYTEYRGGVSFIILVLEGLRNIFSFFDWSLATPYSMASKLFEVLALWLVYEGRDGGLGSLSSYPDSGITVLLFGPSEDSWVMVEVDLVIMKRS